MTEDIAALALVLLDLDRCEHGRHEGDQCFSCPEGMSGGNPHMAPNQVIGYGLDGVPIVVPETRAARKDREAWYAYARRKAR